MKTIALPLFLAVALVIPHSLNASDNEAPTTFDKLRSYSSATAVVLADGTIEAVRMLLDGKPKEVQAKGFLLGLGGLIIVSVGLTSNSPLMVAIPLITMMPPGAFAYFVGYLREPENEENAAQILRFLRIPEAILGAVAASQAANHLRSTKSEEHSAIN